MTNSKKQAALEYLKRHLRQAEISLCQAEQRKNNQAERENLAKKMDTLDWIIGIVTKTEEGEVDEDGGGNGSP